MQPLSNIIKWEPNRHNFFTRKCSAFPNPLGFMHINERIGNIICNGMPCIKLEDYLLNKTFLKLKKICNFRAEPETKGMLFP